MGNTGDTHSTGRRSSSNTGVMVRQRSKYPDKMERNHGETSQDNEALGPPASVDRRQGSNSERTGDIPGILPHDGKWNPLTYPIRDGEKYPLLHLGWPERTNSMDQSDYSNLGRRNRCSKRENEVQRPSKSDGSRDGGDWSLTDPNGHGWPTNH